jgi:hypothetical protein
MAKRAAPLKTYSQQVCEAGDLAEYGLGGTVGSRGGPPARSRSAAGCKTRSIPLGAAVDRTPLVPIDLVPGPIPAVPLRRGREGHGLDHDIIADP